MWQQQQSKSGIERNQSSPYLSTHDNKLAQNNKRYFNHGQLKQFKNFYANNLNTYFN